MAEINLVNVDNNFWYGEKTEDNKNIGVDIAEIVIKSFSVKSKNEARKLIESGGVRWNGHKIIDPFARISLHNDDGKFILLEDFSFDKNNP